MAVLRELNGSRCFPLQDKTIIGRDPVCDVVVGTQRTSRCHAMIIHMGSAYYVDDLNSANGTYVNDQRISQRTRLAPGDRLAICGVEFAFELRELAAVPPPDGKGPALEGLFAETQTRILSSLDVGGEPRVQVAPEAKLRAILEISKNLGNTLRLREVLPKILESLFEIFPQADRGFILLRDPDSGQLVPSAVRAKGPATDDSPPISRTVVDHALLAGRAILTSNAAIDERFDTSPSIQRLNLRSVMCVPLLSQAGTGLGVIQLDTQDVGNRFVQEDLDVLISASLQAGRAVELAQLHQEQQDLEAATQIQKSFLPHERPRIEGLQFFDYYSAARHIGGDYYDYIPLPGNRLAVALGDVVGKGVSAALLMARLSAAARSCLAAAPSVAEAVQHLSAVLTGAGCNDRFVTFLVLVVDLSTYTMTLVNAGHLPPLRRNVRRAEVEALGTGILGLPLAVLDLPYKETVIPLEPGDTLLLHTDGVTEARDPAGRLYGMDRLYAAMREAPADAEQLGRAVLADVQRFAAGRPQSDDLTLVSFSRRP